MSAEIGALYARSAGLVRGHVRCGVAAPEAVIEDACQVAWSRLLHHQERVSRDRAVAWVITTAVHEAFKFVRRSDREVSLDQLVDETGDLYLQATSPSLIETVESRLRLELLDALPQRQQRLLWLQGLGFGYTEMATGTGSTVRTVERQLAKARRRLRLMERAAA
ncbi:MAG TPA: sigma-70 family RNA polymerase sigma factor [Solirubrobacteraceae bacterium]|nr:sigma-70 family RNA polymerase sigma factor [Solirubrobacteraceae bacterium]